LTYCVIARTAVLFKLERGTDGEEARTFPRSALLLRVLCDVVIDVDVEDEDDDKQVIRLFVRLFDDEEVVLREAVAALLADRVSATIKCTNTK